MMNRIQSSWCDFQWNPVTGCRSGCQYCSAARMARRFAGDIRLNKNSPQMEADGRGNYILERPFHGERGKVLPMPAGFEPTFHKYRLEMIAQKKRAAVIGVCQMGELFGPWVPTEWIRQVLDACTAAPWHTYLFLTRYPERYEQLDELAILPEGKHFWYGTTVADGVRPFRSERHNTFISFEPVQGPVADAAQLLGGQNWAVLGTEKAAGSSRTAPPERAWIEPVVSACEREGVPLYMVDSGPLREIWPELVQQQPHRRSKKRRFVRCLDCSYHSERPRHYDAVHGTMRCFHTCRAGGVERKIPGRYVRCSAPWCPRRERGEQH